MDAALHILILAAGAASRMAPRDKLLEPVDGQPLLARITRFALETTAPVTVILPSDRPLRNASVAGLPVHLVTAVDARAGMAESLKAGVTAVPEGQSIMLLLADFPELDLADLTTMITSWRKRPDRIHQGTSSTGEPGHPVIFPARFRAELLALQGDRGAKSILAAHAERVDPVPLPGRHALTDLDTAEDWDNWRKARAGE